MISFGMETKPTVYSKLADWITAFNSISDQQPKEARILGELISSLQKKMMSERIAVIPAN